MSASHMFGGIQQGFSRDVESEFDAHVIMPSSGDPTLSAAYCCPYAHELLLVFARILKELPDKVWEACLISLRYLHELGLIVIDRLIASIGGYHLTVAARDGA